VVIDVDQKLSLLDAAANHTEALETGAVSGDDAIELAAGLGRLEPVLGIKEGQLARNRVLVPTNDFLLLVLQRDGQAQLRANAVAIRPDMAHDTNGFARADAFKDPQNDLRGLHA